MRRKPERQVVDSSPACTSPMVRFALSSLCT